MTTGIIIGVVIGIVVSSIYWALIFSNNKKKVRRAQEERDQVIGPVAEKLADIDVLMASFRSGLVQDEEFRKSLSLKLEAVNRLLKPNLHKLDVYYVKYVENLVRDFNRLAYRRSDKSKEIAEVISSMEDVSYGDFQEESVEQETGELISDLKNETSEISKDVSESFQDVGEQLTQEASELKESLSEDAQQIASDLSESRQELEEGLKQEAQELQKAVEAPVQEPQNAPADKPATPKTKPARPEPATDSTTTPPDAKEVDNG